jgi:hypothetical protein
MQDSPFQLGQKQVINELEKQVSKNAISFSTVSAPETSFEDDIRLCLTSVHFPHQALLEQIRKQLVESLSAIDASPYYYSNECLHFTIKNIRTIDNPPNFTTEDIDTAVRVFAEVLPKHTAFTVFYYRLLLFPNNLALIGTTDPAFDDLVLDLDRSLKAAGVPDTKQYVNDKFFFSNITLCRFFEPVSDAFKQKVQELSASIAFEPYTVDTVTLLTANAVMKKKKVIKEFALHA